VRIWWRFFFRWNAIYGKRRKRCVVTSTISSKFFPARRLWEQEAHHFNYGIDHVSRLYPGALTIGLESKADAGSTPGFASNPHQITRRQKKGSAIKRCHLISYFRKID